MSPPGQSLWTPPVLEENNDKDNGSNQDGIPLGVSDLRRRTKMDDRRYREAEAIMDE